MTVATQPAGGGQPSPTGLADVIDTILDKGLDISEEKAGLTDLAHQEALENAVSELARDWDGRITVRLPGPMAPYDFAITHPPIG